MLDEIQVSAVICELVITTSAGNDFSIENLSGLTVSFSSTEPFSVSEEKVRQSQNTSIGNESFELYTKLSFSFPLNVRKGEARTIRFILRGGDSRKERE